MSEEIIFPIREFDVHSIFPRNVNNPDETGSKIVILGKPDSGKTVLILDICYHKKHQFPISCIVNGNEEMNTAFSKHFPNATIHTELTDEIIDAVEHRQQIAKTHLTQPWMFFIKDDCVETASHFRKASVVKLYKRSRHWKLLSILGVQFAFELSQTVRVCIDYAFIFREPNLIARRVIYENFAGIIPNFKLFCKIMDEITEDRTALVISNRTQSNNPSDCVFWYKAKPIPEDFKFCCEDAWLFDEQRLHRVNDDRQSVE